MAVPMNNPLLAKLAGTRWIGTGELWLDPEGNDAKRYDCALRFDAGAIRYTWSFDNETKEGSFSFNERGATWVDEWHQKTPVQCSDVPDAWGIFTVFHEYEVSDNPNWGWQSRLSERPDGSLVLQMTNVTPWGENGRAVRMIFTRQQT